MLIYFQVEAALTTSPDNEELLKLKNDLEEVIQLTCDLIKAQLLDDRSNSGELLQLFQDIAIMLFLFCLGVVSHHAIQLQFL